MNIIFVLIIFTTIVLVHELGHFWAARRAGIKVEEFSIGMGPRLLKFKKGETLYSLKLFPIGGSCRMLGEEYDEEGKEMEQNPRSFNAASRGWRAVVLIGGAALNIAFALIIAVIVALFRFDTDPVVSTIDESSPFYIAGAEVGDRITHIDGRRIRVSGDVQLALLRSDGSPIEVTVDRGGESYTLTTTPFRNEADTRWMIGFGMGTVFGVFSDIPEGWAEQGGVRQLGFFESVGAGAQNLGFVVRATFTAIGRLFTHGIGELMGPIGMVDVVGGDLSDIATEHGFAATFWPIMHFTMFLSVSLGILNLMPIPALDGGRLVFLAVESIRKKALSPELEGKINLAGFVLMMGLILLVAFNDIQRIFSS